MARATVLSGQKGYVGLSKSVRAAMAEEDGAFPKSRWTKAMLVYWIAEAIWYDLDVEIDRDELEAAFASLSKAKLEGALQSAGWHHVGPFARSVAYYEISIVFAVAVAEGAGLPFGRRLRVALDAQKISSLVAELDNPIMRFEDILDCYGYLAVK